MASSRQDIFNQYAALQSNIIIRDEKRKFVSAIQRTLRLSHFLGKLVRRSAVLPQIFQNS
jgi:hypothetical protein